MQACHSQTGYLAIRSLPHFLNVREGQRAESDFTKSGSGPADAAAETESLKRRSARLEESLAHQEKELTLVAGEKEDLVKELGLASQVSIDSFAPSLARGSSQ